MRKTKRNQGGESEVGDGVVTYDEVTESIRQRSITQFIPIRSLVEYGLLYHLGVILRV